MSRRGEEIPPKRTDNLFLISILDNNNSLIIEEHDNVIVIIMTLSISIIIIIIDIDNICTKNRPSIVLKFTRYNFYRVYRQLRNRRAVSSAYCWEILAFMRGSPPQGKVLAQIQHNLSDINIGKV